ncbi:MAG: cell division protein FtsH [Verrucomicrobia bacterium GWF2_51_19]|nr:MAG: cell division protein FtsH [Verrucomicrobia bacterium GWF2_51_19]
MSKKKHAKKEYQPQRFQPKVFLIWSALLALVLYSWFAQPHQTTLVHLSMQEVVTAAEKGDIVEADIKPDTSGGPSWYHIFGKIKNSESLQRRFSDNDKLKDLKVLPFEAEGRLTDSRFNELMDSNSGLNLKERPASTFLNDIVMSIVPFLIIIGILYFLFMRQIKMAGKGAMSFGKSKARMLTRDNKKTTFKDVAGCDEAKEEVQEIVEFLKDPQKFQKIGGRIPKGCLMVGAPGTGKTVLARAVAGEAEVPFFSISGSDFVEMFVGVGAARVRDMFEQARKNAPCIVFIDEIDAVGRQRGAGLGGGNDEREQTLNSLLVEMDGFDGREGVIIIAATNRPDVLDSALLRPGRFDRQIVLDLPDLKGREEILKVHVKKIKIDKDVNLEVVARNTPGFSGADLENLLNEAALLAARHNKSAVEPIDLDEAREKISFGRERRKLMDDEDRKITAYHEAGHAIIQAKIDDGYMPVHKVTIIPRGQSLGSTMFSPKKDILNQSKKRALNQICCAMGGRVAEELIFKDITSGASSDIKSSTRLARKMVCDWGMSSLGTTAWGENQDHIFLGKEITRNQNYSEETAQKIDAEIKGIIDKQYARSKRILSENKTALHATAAALLQYETIEGNHVLEILSHGAIQSPIVQNELKTK